jgi:RNA polymerase sigma factor (sigma-70 family)
MSLADEEWIRSCRNGQPEAFRHLIQRHEMPLVRYLRARLRSADEATEVAQEAFVRAYFALDKLRKPEAFFPWLLGIADRVAKEVQRAARRCRTVDCRQIEPAGPVEVRESESQTAVAEAVARLPDTYREVIVLRFYGGHSCSEISYDLDVPLGTVTKRLSRAYALLRETMENEGLR